MAHLAPRSFLSVFDGATVHVSSVTSTIGVGDKVSCLFSGVPRFAEV